MTAQHPYLSRQQSQAIRSLRIKYRHLYLVLLLLCILSGLSFKAVTSTRAAASGPALSVSGSGGYWINPDIYGACGYGGPTVDFAREIKLPLCRWGGDNTSRYNWEANASNNGVDFWFLGGGSKTATPGANVDAFIDQNNQIGARSLITIPMIPYIEKSNDHLCAFSIKKYGYDNVGGWGAFWFDWNGKGLNGVDGHYDCADGVYTKNSGKSGYFYGNDPHDTSTENSPTIQQDWVKHLVQRYGPSSKSGIIYELDNEPSNWGYLHRDVYKQKLTYDELIKYTLQYGPAIKQADSTAKVEGPNDLGFAWMPELGGKNNMIKYLQAMQQYDKQNGKRLLDIFSEHYPDSEADHWPNASDVDTVRQLVDQYYPGTQIGFDEWNIFPKNEPLGGALATANELGIFARDRVAEAAYWTLSDATKPPAYAFRMYRDYDGNGGKFGDTYLPSTSADNSQLSVYGAKRSSDGALTIMVVNKTATDLSSALSLSGLTPGNTAQVYTYSSANLNGINRQADQAVSTTGFTHTYGADSLTLIVIPAPNTALSSVLSYDPFNAAAGALNGVNGGSGWSSSWQVQNNDTTQPGYNVATTSPLSYSNLRTSTPYLVGGNKYLGSGRTFDTSSTGPFASFVSNGLIGKPGQTLWVSALLRKDVATDQENSITLHNSNSGWCTGCASSRLGLGYFGSGSNSNGTRYWSIKINTTVYQSKVPITIAQTALLVARIDFGATTTVSLYINPSSLGGNAPSPNVQATTTSNLAFQSLAYYGGDSPGQSSLGEIRLGTSYGAVTPIW